MNEIEKMHNNCNLLKPHAWSCKLDRIGDGEICELEKEVLHCKNCKYSKQEYYHEPFTTEKQVELIKWLAKIGIRIDKVNSEFTFSIFGIISDFSSFEESLANLINNIWKDLTEEEKRQVKEILE